MSVKKATKQLDKQVSKGKLVEAGEQYFADNVVTKGHGQSETVGKKKKLQELSDFKKSVKKFNKIKVGEVAIIENVSFTEYVFEFELKNGDTVRISEVIERHWQEELVVQEVYRLAMPNSGEWQSYAQKETSAPANFNAEQPSETESEAKPRRGRKPGSGSTAASPKKTSSGTGKRGRPRTKAAETEDADSTKVEKTSTRRTSSKTAAPKKPATGSAARRGRPKKAASEATGDAQTSEQTPDAQTPIVEPTTPKVAPKKTRATSASRKTAQAKKAAAGKRTSRRQVSRTKALPIAIQEGEITPPPATEADNEAS